MSASFDVIAGKPGVFTAEMTTPSASPGLNGSMENGKEHSTKARIFELTSYSSKLETVLLALLKDQQDLLEKFEAFRSQYDADKEEHEGVVNALNDRLEGEVNTREAADQSLRDAVNDVAKQNEQDKHELATKIAEANKAIEESNAKGDDKLKDIKDEILKRIDRDKEDTEAKIQRDIDAAKDDLAKELSEKMQINVDELKGNMDEMEKNVADLLNKERSDREKLEADMKMAVEEEKMLRGQDIGILKFNLNEGVKEIKDAVDANKANLDKVLEEEREERQAQNMDVIDKLDKDKREKAAAVASVQHQLEADLDKAKSDLANEILEVVAKESKDRQNDVAKLNKDLDDLHEASIKEIKGVSGDLHVKLNDQERATDEKFKQFAKTLDDDNHQMHKHLEEQKQNLQDKLNEEILKRSDEFDKLNDVMKHQVDNVEKIQQGVSDLVGQVNKEKSDRTAADTDLGTKIEKLVNEAKDCIDKVSSGLDDRLSKEAENRAKEKGDFKDQMKEMKDAIEDDLKKSTAQLQTLVDNEADERKKDKVELIDTIDKTKKGLVDNVTDKCKVLSDSVSALEAKEAKDKTDLESEMIDLKNALTDGLKERETEVKLVNDNLAQKLEHLRLKTDEMEKVVDQENTRRKQEALDLKERLEREKRELQDYIDKDNKDIRDKLEKEKADLKAKMEEESERLKKANEDIQHKLAAENENIQAKIEGESKRLKEQMEQQQSNLHKQLEHGKQAREELHKKLEQEKADLAERMDRENKAMEEKLKSESKQLKDKLEGEAKMIKNEFEKDKEETKKEQQRLEQEMMNDKLSFAEKLKLENEQLQAKMKKEQEERAKRESEMKAQIQETSAGNKSEVLELFDRVKRDLDQRKQETQDLEKKVNDDGKKRTEDLKRIIRTLNGEKRKLSKFADSCSPGTIPNGSNDNPDDSCLDFDISAPLIDMHNLLKRNADVTRADNDSLKAKLDGKDKSLLELSKMAADLRDSLDQQAKDFGEKLQDSQDFKQAMLKKNDNFEIDLKTLKDQILQTLRTVGTSVYFNALREEPYVNGGEEYLTFSSCSVNVSNSMEPKTGVFTAPVSGVYLLALHVCTHDLKKALLSIRQNGKHELASVYDQNHNDNHKNSMAGTCTIVQLNAGDKIQVYMYTFTGLHDKPGNSLTQFAGCLLRPSE